MASFEHVPNIGSVLSQKLVEAGIENIEALRQQGSETAFSRIRIHDPEACLDMLYALEGAVQGIRWHQLSKEKKAALKSFFNNL